MNHPPRRPKHHAPPIGTQLTSNQIPNLPLGTALYIEPTSHRGRTRGRLTARTGTSITLVTTDDPDERTMTVSSIERAHVIASPFHDGELVAKRGVPLTTWGGGIVHLGTNPATGNPGAWVEGTDGFQWIDEARLVSLDRGASRARRRPRVVTSLNRYAPRTGPLNPPTEGSGRFNGAETAAAS